LFALDTEFVTERTYRPELALIQIALPARVALVDAQAVPELTPLWELVAAPDTLTVVHAGEQEARFCWQATAALPQNFVDVQLAAGFIGERYPLAYAKLVRSLLDIPLKQDQTRSDWTRRPLTAPQLAYATEDVRHLLPLWQRLSDRLDALGRRSWFETEAAQRLVNLQDDLTETRWWQLAGAQRMGRRGLAAVRELYLWREAVAARRDLPRKWVLRDDLIISAAQTLPATAEDLRRLRGFERLRERDLAAVLNCLHRARELPQPELPRNPERREYAPDQARMLVLLLEAVLESICAEQHLDGALIGSASAIRELIRWHLNGCAADSPPALLKGWRATVCGDALEAALAGDVSVRVADPRSSHPLVLERESD
ncbi:MAG: HRDC domain-containing protein, partial [Dehalococcoidia bacterium]